MRTLNAVYFVEVRLTFYIVFACAVAN